MIPELAHYTRTALGLAKWARTSPEADPRKLVIGTLRNRENNFLELLHQGVFNNPANPYNQLLAWAGRDRASLESLTRDRGIEGALATLYAEGVYLTHDEFKGKTPVVRGSRHLEVTNSDLANPAVKGLLDVSSSGSRSRGTVTRRSLEY